MPLLQEIKKCGISIGLITNCFSEEAAVIQESVLYPYFDAVCMSCKLGLRKPDRRIFHLCLEQLQVLPEECLYCGDGGSHELEVARDMGMQPLQALWYLKEGSGQPVGKVEQFQGAQNPLDLLSYIRNE